MTSNKRKPRVVIDPLRWTIGQAAQALNMSIEQLRPIINEGVFTTFSKRGETNPERGRGKRFFLDPQEVKIYSLQGAAGVAEFRQANNRIGTN